MIPKQEKKTEANMKKKTLTIIYNEQVKYVWHVWHVWHELFVG